MWSLNTLTLSPPNKLSAAEFLVCVNFQSASMSLKIGENVVRVSNSLDPDETTSYSSFIQIQAVCIWHYRLGGLRVKNFHGFPYCSRVLNKPKEPNPGLSEICCRQFESMQNVIKFE